MSIRIKSPADVRVDIGNLYSPGHLRRLAVAGKIPGAKKNRKGSHFRVSDNPTYRAWVRDTIAASKRSDFRKIRKRNFQTNAQSVGAPIKADELRRILDRLATWLRKHMRHDLTASEADYLAAGLPNIEFCISELREATRIARQGRRRFPSSPV